MMQGAEGLAKQMYVPLLTLAFCLLSSDSGSGSRHAAPALYHIQAPARPRGVHPRAFIDSPTFPLSLHQATNMTRLPVPFSPATPLMQLGWPLDSPTLDSPTLALAWV